ncbi:MAG: HlyD family secretion protein [Acidobacteria bacterium]|nr:HlyD family secretion protein [Acidobacteriota bacterium]
MKKWIGLVIILAFTAGMVVAWRIYWKHEQLYPSTADAYVAGDIYQVAARIPGTIVRLPVDENQVIERGALIAELDPRDMDRAVDEAAAALQRARAVPATVRARIAQAQAEVDEAASKLHLKKTDLARFSELVAKSSIPRRTYDQAVTAEKVAAARKVAAQKALAAARAQLVVSERAIHMAQAALAAARLKRSFCTIRSPIAGIISKKTAHVGQVVSPGQPLCAVVPLEGEHLWIEANFKETQLARIHPGQEVRFYTDVDPGREYRGTVESLSAGTGAAFSLLPPENATGNWVKIVQRLPVHIAIDADSNALHALRLGLSVHVTVDTAAGAKALRGDPRGTNGNARAGQR